MESKLKRDPLRIQLSSHQESKPLFEDSGLLSGFDFEDISYSTENSQNKLIEEMQAQLDVVNEDRQRLKSENERLKLENSIYMLKTMGKMHDVHYEIVQKKASEIREVNIALNEEVKKLREEAENKEKLLSLMRSLLGDNTTNPFVLAQNDNKPKRKTYSMFGLNENKKIDKKQLDLSLLQENSPIKLFQGPISSRIKVSRNSLKFPRSKIPTRTVTPTCGTSRSISPLN